MFPSRKLHFFISSTGDLQGERASIQESLRLFEIDGLRFEEWPSMPDDPMEVCLEGVRSSDAVVLLLGSSYGTPDKIGLSGTHQEFRHASKINRPIFAFLLKAEARDPRQVEFIGEVQRAVFRCVEISSVDELAQSLRVSVAAEFSRRWKHFERHPPEFSSPWGEAPAAPPLTILGDRDDMLAELKNRYASGDDDAISAAADAIMSRHPGDRELLNIVCQAAVNEGIGNQPVNRPRVEAAVELWKADCPVEPIARAGRLYCLGNALYVLKRYDEAITAYRESLQVHPEFAECWKNLGSAYHDRGDHAEARMAYEEVLKIEPRKFEALYSLATLLIRHLADPADALTHLEAIDTAALGSDRLGSVMAWRAEAKLLLGQLTEAAADAEESIHLHPESDWTWTAAARVYAQARHSEPSLNVAALRFWERFVARFPRAAEAWLELGFLLFRLREHRDKQEFSRRALIAYEKAIELGVDDSLVWDRTGHLLQDAGRWEDAAERYAKAAAGDASSHGYCYGFVLRHLGRYKEALPYALAAVEQHQPDGMSWVLVADCKAKLRDYDGAIAAYLEAMKVEPTYEKAWFDLGGLLWNIGNSELALTVWKVALAKFPESEEAVRLVNFLDALIEPAEVPLTTKS
jgi:tetratricopeptide (TPR) repeat protein